MTDNSLKTKIFEGKELTINEISSIKRIRTLNDNNFYENYVEERKNTKVKYNNIDMSKQEMMTTKMKNTKHNKSKKYKLFHKDIGFLGIYNSIFIRKIGGNLHSKTLENYLSKTNNAKAQLNRKNSSLLVGLYVIPL